MFFTKRGFPVIAQSAMNTKNLQDRTSTTVLDLVFAIGDRFVMDTKEVANEFFGGNHQKAYNALQTLPGVSWEDVNGGWAHNSQGTKQSYVWQVMGDEQGWSMEDARAYVVGYKGNPDKVLWTAPTAEEVLNQFQALLGLAPTKAEKRNAKAFYHGPMCRHPNMATRMAYLRSCRKSAK